MPQTVHPLILEGSKICKRCGYKLAGARMHVHSHPITRAILESNIVKFTHPHREAPMEIHRFIKQHFEPNDLRNKIWSKKGTGEITLQLKPQENGGHELVLHSERFKNKNRHLS